MAGLWPGYGARGGEGQNGRDHVCAALPAGQGWVAGRMSRDYTLGRRRLRGTSAGAEWNGTSAAEAEEEARPAEEEGFVVRNIVTAATPRAMTGDVPPSTQ